MRELDDHEWLELVEMDGVYNDGLGAWVDIKFDGEYLTVEIEYPNETYERRSWVCEPRPE